MLTVSHIELKEANAYVTANHRHHGAVRGHRFSLACYENGRLCGVVIVGRPRSRRIDQHMTVEVLRLCTDGTKNVCSKLYGACRRAARALGYERLITYILENENGKSLLASGFSYCYTNRGGSWNQPGRPRTDNAPVCPKHLYEIILVRKEDETCRTS
ncbi:XF1762 family protein [Lacrimispora sp. 38-1]|uniref:XF1762 family protein n=1 Tax=Lacrimispora sp. 38-1 TaxID=3125778 RepID=UPI003CEF2C85